jgi:hypothetical protein
LGILFLEAMGWHVLLKGRVSIGYQWLMLQFMRSCASALTALPR